MNNWKEIHERIIATCESLIPKEATLQGYFSLDNSWEIDYYLESDSYYQDYVVLISLEEFGKKFDEVDGNHYWRNVNE